MTPEQILERLDEQQREVALAVQGPVCVLAGAGTGKTRAITHRIAYGVAVGVYDPRRVMAVTFTTKAAGEMRTRLRALGAEVQARTFHSAALSQLAHFWPRLAGGRGGGRVLRRRHPVPPGTRWGGRTRFSPTVPPLSSRRRRVRVAASTISTSGL